MNVQPLYCGIDHESLTIEFELELHNAGTAPARAILAEASLFNAGDAQDQQLAAFFAKPAGPGQRLDSIAPMRSVPLTSQVVAPRETVQEYELAGGKASVPMIAFNIFYEWSGGEARSSGAFLIGREMAGDKLGPLRVDLGAREYRKLAAHALPIGGNT